MIHWRMWDLPFFEDRHHSLAEALASWQAQQPEPIDTPDLYALHAECRRLAIELARSGFLEYAVPRLGVDGRRTIDVRSICLIREALSYVSPLADFVFAMQGIGTSAIWLFGSDEMQERYLSACREGHHIAAFAMSEPDGSSDIAAITTTAVADGDAYVLNGKKAWVSNAGLANHYIMIARTEMRSDNEGLSAFMVDANTPGLVMGEPVDLISPHPIGEVGLSNCRVPHDCLIGSEGDGFRIAMATLGIFRSSVGAAAVGLARRALDETLERLGSRQLFGQPMSKMDSVRMKLADMSIDLDMAVLATYRAAWCKDVRQGRHSREVATAKLVGTEAAQRIIDAAVQLFGAAGVVRGNVIERLYRDIRPMRIYEGASEVQKLIIGRSLLEQ
jgi:acyl-CoA dehydrogenase